MQKFLIALLFALLIAPSVSFAAFDDVTLTTDAVITVGGIDLTISGSSAVVETITVGADSFNFTMPSGTSALQVSSADRRVLSTNSPSQYIGTNECNSSASVLKHSFSGVESVTITVTPQSSTCGTSATNPAAASTASASSGGGGTTPAGLNNPTPPSTVAQNIGITVKPAAETTVAQATTPASTAPPAAPPVAPTVSPIFTRALSPGATHADVKRLQQLLNSDPETRIAESGAGSPKSETKYFGSLTTKAIQKFQVKYGVAGPGIPGYGNLGPKTRAKLQEIFNTVPTAPALPTTPGTEQAAATPAGTVSPVFTRALSPGNTHRDVKRLQQLLNSDPETRIAETGVGSSGNETEYFGSLTTKAIRKFQVKYGVAGPGIPGYGNFGPKTRAKLQEVFGR